MLLYHYSKNSLPILKTRRLLSTEIQVQSKNKLDYNDHISFFFERPPFEILGTIFGKDHPVWFPVNKLYEHIVDTQDLDTFFYDLVEFPEKTIMFYDNSIKDSEYFKRMALVIKEKKYQGTSVVDLEKACLSLKGTTREYFSLLPTRVNFSEIKGKYAATVPHLMIYPEKGYVKVRNSKQIVIGNQSLNFKAEAVSGYSHW